MQCQCLARLTSSLLALLLLAGFSEGSASDSTQQLELARWPVSKAQSGTQLVSDQLQAHWGDELQLSWHNKAPNSKPIWFDLILQADDGRLYTSAAALRMDRVQDRIRCRLNAADWSSPHGPLSADALAGCHRLSLRINSSNKDHQTFPSLEISHHRSLPPAEYKPPSPLLRLPSDFLVRQPHWYAIHIEILGFTPSQADTVALRLPGGRLVPCFLHQDGQFQAQRFISHGQARWAARLRPAELEGVTSIQLSITNDSHGEWLSDTLRLPELKTVSTQKPHIPKQTAVLDWQLPGLDGLATVHQADNEARLITVRRQDNDHVLAPQLFWQRSWTDYRGGDLVSHAAAARLCGMLGQGWAGIDVLPQRLFEERSTWRFGLSPWHQAQAGSWRMPEEAFANEEPIKALQAHAKELVARCRATPGLSWWQISATNPANNRRQHVVLKTCMNGIATWLARYDHRPLLVAHPQLRPYHPEKQDTSPWFSFERHNQYWTRMVSGLRTELKYPWANITSAQANHGQRSLQIDLPVSSSQSKVDAGIVNEVDANLFNLHRLEMDVLLQGCGMATLYCWVSDDSHRWYQQRLQTVHAGRHWRSVGIEFGDDADWQSVGHQVPWDGSKRRRIRRLGIHAYHLRPSMEKAEKTTLYVDNMRRFGWPRMERPEPQLTMGSYDKDLSCHDSLHAEFTIDLTVANPFDPDHADVVAELQAPDGRLITHPCYWARDRQPDSNKLHRELTPRWRWHLRFGPDIAGLWRWRIKARLRHQDTTISVGSNWHESTVTAAKAKAMLPVRQSPDPRYWQRSDGSFFYPIGLNLRSPGDDRQDALLRNQGSQRRSIDWEKDGLAAYERWFDAMQANGMNYARIWMCPWWCGLEWTRTWDGFGGLTVFNQENADMLDDVLAMARSRGIYVQIELQNHGMTSIHVDHQWELSPYRRDERGHGLVSTPDKFFSDEACWKALQKRHRYVIARWGHHSHLMAWVLSSEMEFTGAWWKEAYQRGYSDSTAHSETTAKWVRKNLDWFAANDYRKRPISIHFSHPWRAQKLWTEKGLGFSNSNVYTGFQTKMEKLGGSKAGLGSAFTRYLTDHFPPWTLQRPSMVGEWGGHWEETDPDKLEAELRVGTWLQAVLPYGGNVGFWWWLWIDAAEAWPRYGAISRFMQTIDPRGQHDKPFRPQVSDGDAAVWITGSLGTDRHRFYCWLRGIDRRLGKRSSKPAGLCTVPTGQAGSVWHLRRFNPEDGKEVYNKRLQADAEGDVIIELGIIDPDAAFTLTRIDAGQAREAESQEPDSTPSPRSAVPTTPPAE